MKIPPATVILKTYSGQEAETILAQAEGYRRIMWEVLRGEADRDPVEFRRSVQQIGFEQANRGA